MRFPLTDQLIDEARRFNLRSACPHCLYYVAARDRCAHEWPLGDQARWPLEAPDPDGERPAEADFCREFEMR